MGEDVKHVIHKSAAQEYGCPECRHKKTKSIVRTEGGECRECRKCGEKFLVVDDHLDFSPLRFLSPDGTPSSPPVEDHPRKGS